jgi:hypothetical protein
MKTSTNLLQAEKCQNEETPKKASAGKLLKYLLFSFMFLQIFVLYSCALEYRTPRYDRNGVMISRNDRNNRNNRNDRNDHNNRNDQYNNGYNH